MARSRGYNPNARTLAHWARTASDPQRQRAFLRYLLMIPATLARATLDERIPWLPPLSDLESSPLLSGWTAAERSMLLLLFGFVPSSTGTWTAPDHYVPPDADGVLEGIHEWWLRNGDSLRGSSAALSIRRFRLERLTTPTISKLVHDVALRPTIRSAALRPSSLVTLSPGPWRRAGGASWRRAAAPQAPALG